MFKPTALLIMGSMVALGQQGEDKKVYKVGNGVTAPRVLSKVDPQYTKEASAAKIQGSVLLSLIVGSDGVARDIAVLRSLEPGLDNNAIAAVQQWKFQPGTRYGESVDVKATIEVNFRLLTKKDEAGDAKIYRVGNGVTAPSVLERVEPDNTNDASAAKIQGTVLLGLTVGSDGIPRDIVLRRGLESGMDQKAIAAVQQWKFKPGTKDGTGERAGYGGSKF